MANYFLSSRNWYSPIHWPWPGRHLFFWAVYFLLIPYQTDLYGLTAGYNLTIAVQTLPLDLLNVYSFIYLVLPHLLSGSLVTFWFRFGIWCLGLWADIYFFWYLIIIPINMGLPILQPANAAYQYTYSLVAILMHVCLTGVAASLKLWRYWYQKEATNQELMQEMTLAELQLLKAQIHPHFLFNTLNNLYSLTLRQADNAPEIVLKLTDLLHYMLNECNVAYVSVQQEKQAIESYIELEKLRYGKRLRVTLDTSGDLTDKHIPPLLLIPFVENAFKHGPSGQIGQGYIHVQLRVDRQELVFIVKNSRTEEPMPPPAFGGMGLKNVQKRLTLLFPHQHKLVIRPETNAYETELIIPLHDIVTTRKTVSHSV